MNVFSLEFFAIWLIAFICYYTFGRKYQWQILTVVSIAFYILSIKKIPLVLVLVWLVTYLSARFIVNNFGVRRKICFWTAIVLSIALLTVGRVTNIFAMLGNSYFVLKAIGYVIDVDRDEPIEKNIFKYLLYLIYWPTVFEGPFNRISDFFSNFSVVHVFNYENLAHGVQRFLWGAFKKLVVAERLAIVVNNILSKPVHKGGRFVIIAVIAYAIQVYADFSGFMDMMLGLSQTLGITLPENFKQPYFSKSIPEFWRRWHITLGLWFRDYVMFPFTSCAPVKAIAKKIRKKNKTLGKLLPLLAGTCFVWLLTGLWHNFSKNYLVWGLFYAVLMCLSQTYNAYSKKADTKKSPIVTGLIDTASVLKTIVLVLIADIFVCVEGLRKVLLVWKEILFNFGGGKLSNLMTDSFSKEDVVVLIIALALMLIVSIIKEKGYSPLILLDKTPFFVRWIVYYGLIFSILILGLYGAEYDASQFVYMQF